MWYSPPFYLGDVTGLKFRFVVYPNGVQESEGTHVSLIVECLESDAKEPKDIQCGSHIKIIVSNKGNNYLYRIRDICGCKNSHEIWLDAAVNGFHCEYWFMAKEFAQELCYNDTLELQTSWCINYSNCDCTCHT